MSDKVITAAADLYMSVLLDNVRQAMLKSGLTIEELAEECEVSTSVIQNLRMGKTANPFAVPLIKVCFALGVSLR